MQFTFGECKKKITVNATLTFGNAPMKTLTTRFGNTDNLKQDCILEDLTGVIKCSLWQKTFDKVHSSKTVL